MQDAIENWLSQNYPFEIPVARLSRDQIEEKFGKLAEGLYNPPGYRHWWSNDRWTLQGNRIFFKHEADALMFKMEFV